MPEWGERQPDGSVVVYRDGVPVRTESWEQNQGPPPAPPGHHPVTWTGGEGAFTPPGGTGSLGGFDQTKGPDGQPLRPGQKWERAADGNFVFVDPYGGQGSGGWPGGQVPAGAGGGGGGFGGLIDAAARGGAYDQDTRRMDVQGRIEDAARRYALAVTQEQRNQAYMDLQRWEVELKKINAEQGRFTDAAQTILSAAVGMGSRPADYVKYNQIVSGGRDIFDVMSGKAAPGAAFGGPAGQIRPGSVEDLLGRLGLQYPQTPATPAGVQPGAANPPVVPGQPAGGTGTASPDRPGLDEMKSGLRTAGWGGNYEDPESVATAWWDANPSRKGTPRPTRWW